MKYQVIVGERKFAELEDKVKAIELAKACSGFYLERVCKVLNPQLEIESRFVNGDKII